MRLLPICDQPAHWDIHVHGNHAETRIKGAPMNNYPTRDEILRLVLNHLYSGKTLNNSHRGDVVEMMVMAALGEDWKFVGLGWHPWDLQRGSGDDRVRIQVKQSAALQLWGATVNQVLSLNWSDKAPSYFARDNPGEAIEEEGWFCELFIFGIHQEGNIDLVDQVDPRQWKFLVVPTCDLKRGAKSITLRKALQKWPLYSWIDLADAVEEAIKKLSP